MNEINLIGAENATPLFVEIIVFIVLIPVILPCIIVGIGLWINRKLKGL